VRSKTAQEERQTAWERRRVLVSSDQQHAEVPDLYAVCPEVTCPDYAAVDRPVLQDVQVRHDHPSRAHLRRAPAGETPDDPRVPGAHPIDLRHLSPMWWPARPLDDRARSQPMASSAPGYAQDEHDPPESGRRVRQYLPRRHTHGAAPRDRRGDGQGRGRAGMRLTAEGRWWDGWWRIRATPARLQGGEPRPTGRCRAARRGATGAARQVARQSTVAHQAAAGRLPRHDGAAPRSPSPWRRCAARSPSR
jgi:hypothetical protein